MPSAAEGNALDAWLQSVLRDRQVHTESDLVALWRSGPGAGFDDKAAAKFVHERLKSLESGLAVVRAPGTRDGWWSPN